MECLTCRVASMVPFLAWKICTRPLQLAAAAMRPSERTATWSQPAWLRARRLASFRQLPSGVRAASAMAVVAVLAMSSASAYVSLCGCMCVPMHAVYRQVAVGVLLHSIQDG